MKRKLSETSDDSIKTIHDERYQHEMTKRELSDVATSEMALRVAFLSLIEKEGLYEALVARLYEQAQEITKKDDDPGKFRVF